MTARIATLRIATATTGSVADPLAQPVRRYDIPKLRPRRFTDEHPMAMFAMIVITAFIAMVMLPAQGPAQAAISPEMVQASGEAGTADKADKPLDIPVDEACRGQAWGAESLACLTVIARESTGAARRIRLVAADHINSSTPNVF